MSDSRALRLFNSAPATSRPLIGVLASSHSASMILSCRLPARCRSRISCTEPQEKRMKFGLFGGAKSAGDGSAGDSLGYRQYIDYVLHAEALGFHSLFVVEHHFTGVGQVSASLGFLSYLAGAPAASGSAPPSSCCHGTIRRCWPSR
jgi:hypothetical protein